MLTGCKFEYNLNITSDAIEEDNIAYISDASKESIEGEVYKIVEKYSGPTNELGMYDSSIVNKNGVYGVSFFDKYNGYTDYQNSPSFSMCYDKYRIVNDGEFIIISTNGNFKCFDMYEELEDVTINIRSDYSVISSNADKVDGNVSTWYMSRGDSKAINIKLNISSEKANNDSKDNVETADDQSNNDINRNNDKVEVGDDFFQNGAFWVVIAVLVMIGIVVLIVKFIDKKNNDV